MMATIRSPLKCELLVVVFLMALLTLKRPVEGQDESQFVAGGLGGTRPADATAQAMANQVAGAVEGLLGRIFTLFAVQSYRTQVVSGTNYYLKVLIQDTENGQYVAHLRVFKPLHGEASLTGMLFPKMWSDPVSFDGYMSTAES